MLPFLKNQMKQQGSAGVIVKQRAPDAPTGDEVSPDSLEDCIERLLKAFASKDKAQIAQALRDVHDELHLEMSEKSESYDSQNEKAANKEQE